MRAELRLKKMSYGAPWEWGVGAADSMPQRDLEVEEAIEATDLREATGCGALPTQVRDCGGSSGATTMEAGGGVDDRGS